MIWTILISYCATFVFGNKTGERIPFFHGHVFENSPPGSKVNGLNIPVKRVDAQRWCSKTGMHLKLLGNGSEDFHVFAHHKRGHILLKTSNILDREVRAEYFLSVGLCCQSCVSAERVVAEVASIKVDVLDTNDHEPTFRHADVKITLDDATALRSVVYKVTAEDTDSGKNAELIYYALPKNGSFYVVPKTGDILLVDSILGLASPIKFSVFARDHGWPSRTSHNMEIEINPRQWPAVPPPSLPSQLSLSQSGLPRKSRSVLEPDKPLVISVSEDASIGSVIMNLNPVRFQSASFELVYPDAESSPVTVNRDSGDLVISRSLDRETEPLVEITVKVQDKRGPDWYLVRVELTALDVNDNAPEWSMVPFPFLAVVNPMAPSNSLVYKLQARDGDEGPNGEVEYFLSDGGDGRFDVDRKTGHVRTTGLPLQRDREYLLTVVAADRMGSRSPSAVLSVVAGPRAPQFTNASYTISIPENTQAGQPFLVTPALSFQKRPVSYSLLINPSSLFAIQPETGEISLTRAVDYEADQHRYLLLVRASEAEGSLSSATEVRVIILDENDCVPEFLQSIYSKDGIPETVTTATSLLQVSATDCDSGQNADITYYTLGSGFIISPHGTVFPAGPLDYERPNHLYEFVVMAVDKGEVPRTGTATVRLRLANVNDEAPEFSQPVYRTFVSEDAGPNTLVATVLAKDPDGDGITYKISSGNEEGNFVIDSQKGLIRLRSTPPPKLQGVEYILNITAMDDNTSGGPQSLSATAQVIVGVDDVNNNKPIFEKCQRYKERASVPENKPAGTVVLQVYAVDADEGANGKVTYGFMHRDSAVPAFNIDPDTGVIVTARKFDRERQREYAVTVTATDQAAEPLIGICQLNIIILDENDNSPKFETLRYEYFLREDTMIGTSFLRVAAHDDDYSTNAAITYSMSKEQPEYLHVNPVTGWVYVNQPISQRTYITREIIATDGGNRSSSVELSVTITNVKNQPPQWERDSYEVVIPENTVRDTPIVTVKATSPLGDPRVTYNLEDGMVPETNMPVRFYLTPNREDGSASILVAEPLDYETTWHFTLRVRAQNVAAVPLAAFTTVHVNLTDVNDNVPFFTSSIYEASVMEGAEVGTLVLQVSANDLDLGLNGKISYSLLNDRSGDYQFFRIDPGLGSIYTEAVFDRETKGSYLLEVKSVDSWESARPGRHGQPNSDTAYVRIFISDVNDNRPAFAQDVYEVDVDEDADVGSTVLTVSANDGDEGANAKLRYQITSGNMGGVFDVEPEVGTIFVAQPLDYEQTKRYRLHVLASDGKWEDYAVVAVNVVNRNDEAPVFTVNEYYGSVTEELDGSPVFVLQVTASDPDKDADQEALRYSLHGQGAESEFMIDEATGKIYAQRTLDREARAVWRFVVLATDEGGEGLTGFTDVIISVWDINDNAPVFGCAPDSCHGSVAENSPPGTSVMELTATDLDDTAVGQNAVLAYRIVGNTVLSGGSSIVDMFTINGATGTVSVAAAGLDREKTESYLLVVEARDGGGMMGTATATISVMDINDHAPHFLERSCEARIPESSEPNTAVLELAAEDADAGENGQLTFSIVAGDPEQKFYMVSHRQEQRGTLRLKKRLDYERPGEQKFNLTIKVEDLEYSSLLHCTLDVEDYNDHAPVFIPHFLQLPALREDIPVGSSVAMVAASDSDSGSNREITYSIAPESDPHSLFLVDQTGLVTVARQLDREEASQHHLVILATDHGDPPLTGTATIQMSLLDVNDNGPEFEAAYAPVVWENVPGPQVVHLNASSTLLRAIDRDSAENGSPFSFSVPPEYRYSNDFLLRENGNDTATVTALRAFDRERQKEFLLPVIMTDSGKPPQTVTSTLTITIGDKNDHAHIAGEKKIYINTHRGRMPTTVLGKVYAPDPDDWDNKTYSFEGHAPNHFLLNKRTGFLVIKEIAPPGVYDFRVRVADGEWPDAVSTVSVHVRELRDDVIHNSASLRFADITAKEFMEQRGGIRSRYELLRDFLSEMLSVGTDDVNVFSLVEVRDRTLDVRFNVHGSLFLRPERLHGYLAAHKQKLQSFLQVNVTQVHVDECASTPCGGEAGCTTHLSVSDKPTVVDSGSMALVSVTLKATAVCACSAREHLHQGCSTYPRNPCHNGGVCVDTQSGFRCQCPAQFEGPECQQTKHSFHGNGYAWFSPIRPCFESHLTLEFITEVADGLLLYSGPLAQLQPWEPEDFMAIELIDGTPTLKINHGSGTLVLQLPGNVNVADRRWHRLDVRSNSKDVGFTLDRCTGATVMEMEGVGSWLTTEDHTSCEVTGVTPNLDRHLNVTQVLQLGGVNENLPYIYPQLQHKHFTGCIRNLIVDSKVYDLGSPADSSASTPGCLMTDSSCVNMGFPSCGTRGRCHGEWGSFSCQCVAGYAGHQCEQELPEYSFDGRSHVQYQLTGPLPARYTQVQVLIRTRKHSSSILSLLSAQQSEYLRLEIFQGLLTAFYNLGDGDFNLTTPSHRLDNGEWHEVHLDRHDNEVTLRVDGGGGRREVTGSPGHSREIVVDTSMVMLGNSFPLAHNKSFQGCMRDLRLNGRSMPLEVQAGDGVKVISSLGVTPGCSSDSCRRNQCTPPFTCVDLWRVHECRCPPGHIVKANATGKYCMYTLCASHPCHRGTCVAQSPSKFTCHCPEGYRGHRCELTLAVYRDDVGLSFSSLFAICICFMALLVLLLGIFLYTRWRSYKGLKEGVYHVSAHHDGWEDIRENVLNYDEEGGGEEDQNAYDMAELQKSLQPSPAQSVQYSRTRATRHQPPTQQPQQHLLHQAEAPCRAPTAATSTSSVSSGGGTLRRDVPPSRSPAQGQCAGPGATRAARLTRKSLSFSSQDLARYLCEIIRDADQHPETAPFDSLQVFSTEGGGSPAGSLSSFSSAGLEESAATHDSLREWGPRFEKLRALYERAEGSDL
ncbi:neural-cadherin [Electrophorus electricus]|uniref:neural-cadherin n=1 Tax=Electrophorus electricus TaxID=8005 RepID=UPI0015D02F48|nr:neural-cadherin [Electrophorus electricus]